jgi:hypothetical protein
MRKLTIILILVLSGGCKLLEDAPPLAPVATDWGTADFSTYVALGGSITAGMQSGSVFESAQYYNYPSIFTRAAGIIDFEQPLIADPGMLAIDGSFAQGHLRVVLDENGNPTIEPTPWDDPDFWMSMLLNVDLNRSYNNLAIPLLTADELLWRVHGDGTPPNPYLDMFLRSEQTGIEQAISLGPTFMTLMFGFSEIMYPATLGSSELLDSPEEFEASYRTILDQLTESLPVCDFAMLTIPPIAQSAAFSLQPWYVTDQFSEMLPDAEGNPIPLLSDCCELSESDKVYLQAKLKTDEGVGYPYEQVSLAIQIRDGITETEAENMIAEIWPKCGLEVLTGADFLSMEEYSGLMQATSAYNEIIASLAVEYNCLFVDVASIFYNAVEGTTYNGWLITGEFLGGLYSLDGIHPTRYGQAMMTKLLIDAVNQEYGSNLSLPLIEELPQ